MDAFENLNPEILMNALHWQNSLLTLLLEESSLSLPGGHVSPKILLIFLKICS